MRTMDIGHNYAQINEHDAMSKGLVQKLIDRGDIDKEKGDDDY